MLRVARVQDQSDRPKATTNTIILALEILEEPIETFAVTMGNRNDSISALKSLFEPDEAPSQK